VDAIEHGTGEYVATESGPVYVEIEGSGPPVLLVSGGPGVSHVHYHPWFSRLASDHTVVYYDHPGVGRSSRDAGAEAYTLAGYARAIESIRLHLDTATIAVIGLSFGGLPAVEYARTHPTRVRRLVMSNAAYSADTWQLGNIDNVLLCGEDVALRLEDDLAVDGHALRQAITRPWSPASRARVLLGALRDPSPGNIRGDGRHLRQWHTELTKMT
jgi:pimeloyl-ACP methyl ester carboxylesterase